MPSATTHNPNLCQFDRVDHDDSVVAISVTIIHEHLVDFQLAKRHLAKPRQR